MKIVPLKRCFARISVKTNRVHHTFEDHLIIILTLVISVTTSTYLRRLNSKETYIEIMYTEEHEIPSCVS